MATQKGQAILVPVEQDTITFYGHALVAVRLPDGQIAAVLRWLCESLQLDPQGQLQRIERKTALRNGLVRVRVATDGGPQEMPAVTLKVLPGYLFTIDENRVKEDARADVILFQEECVEALSAHFTRKHQDATALVPMATDAAAAQSMVEQIVGMAGTLNLMREHLESLLGIPGQVAEIQGLVESLAERQESSDSRLTALEARTSHLTPAHAHAVHTTIDRIVKDTTRSLTPLNYPTIYLRLQRRFQVTSYKEVADTHYGELMDWLQQLRQSAIDGESPQQGSLF